MSSREKGASYDLPLKNFDFIKSGFFIIKVEFTCEIFEDYV